MISQAPPAQADPAEQETSGSEAPLEIDEPVAGTSTGGQTTPGRALRSQSKPSPQSPRKRTRGKEQRRRASQHKSSSEEDVGAVESQADSGSESSDEPTLSPGQMNRLSREELVQHIARLRKKREEAVRRKKGKRPRLIVKLPVKTPQSGETPVTVVTSSSTIQTTPAPSSAVSSQSVDTTQTEPIFSQAGLAGATRTTPAPSQRPETSSVEQPTATPQTTDTGKNRMGTITLEPIGATSSNEGGATLSEEDRSAQIEALRMQLNPLPLPTSVAKVAAPKKRKGRQTTSPSLTEEHDPDIVITEVRVTQPQGSEIRQQSVQRPKPELVPSTQTQPTDFAQRQEPVDEEIPAGADDIDLLH